MKHKEALKEIQQVQIDLLSQASFDHLSFACIDFKELRVESWSLESHQSKVRVVDKAKIFDLASLTKPLLLSSYYLQNKKTFSPEMLALLEHRIDMPAYGVLSRDHWKENLLSYPLGELSSGLKTRYSDYSSLRLMLEIGQEKLFSFYKSFINKKHHISFWKELSLVEIDQCAPTGFRSDSKSGLIKGQVHDPNAYNLNEFTSHAGLFSCIDSLSQYFLYLNQKLSLLDSQMMRSHKDNITSRPYFEGWDGVQNNEKTLAGSIANTSLVNHSNTFGFLGFTGTSIWINPQLQAGWILLTNATQNYWYDRSILNEIRRKSGQLVWPLFRC